MRPRTVARTAILVALLAAALPVLPAQAQPAPRSLDAACPRGSIGDAGFRDVGGTVHRRAIDCAVHWQVARGRTPTRYAPAAVVDRAQAASFVAGLLLAAGATLPEPSGNTFSDEDGSVHEQSIERLAEAGVVSGRGQGTYQPAAPVTRAQAAALLVRAYDLRARQAGAEPLPPGPDAFADDDGTVHEADTDRAAAAGIVAGDGDGRFRPDADLARDALASLLARTLDVVVAAGMAQVPPAPVLPVSVVAAGDIACRPGSPVTASTCQHARTAAVVGDIDPHAVLLLGDIQYESGSVAEFRGQGGWTGTWSAFFDRTWPAPGNHEWRTPGAAGYRDVFDARTGGAFWYSRDLGAWHLVSLDSDCAHVGGCGAGSPQHEWFQQDLAAADGRPTLVFWHSPRFSSGVHGNDPALADLWATAVADRDVQLVLAGHEHSYERFGPVGADGAPDPEGVRSFVVGTGGRSLRCAYAPQPGSEVFGCGSAGVLSLVLRAADYDWKFVPATGGFTDSGTSRVRPGG
jgi:hypothetical protein